MELNTLKTYRLTCTYLGHTEEREVKGVPSDEDFRDLDGGFVGDVWKWSGTQMLDGHGNFTVTDPMEWAHGEATETGLLDGAHVAGYNADTFKSVNELLGAAECSERLVLVNEDSEPTTNESEADWDETFSTYGPNKAVLELLDSADWEVEETGYDDDRLVEAIEGSETITLSGDFASPNTDGEEAEDALNATLKAAEGAGYVHLAKWGEDSDEFHAVDEHGAGEAAFAALAEIKGVKSLWWEEYRNGSANCGRRDYFCKREDLERVVREFASAPAIFSARLEEDYADADAREIEEEEVFGDWIAGHGTVCDADYVEFEGTVYTKARHTEDGDLLVFERTGEGEWTQQ